MACCFPSHFFVNNHLLTSTSLETNAPAKHHLIYEISNYNSITKFPLSSLQQSKINAHQLRKRQIDHLGYLHPMIHKDKTTYLKFNMTDQDQ